MKTVTVRLTDREMIAAGAVGVKLKIECLHTNNNTHGLAPGNEEGWDMAIVSLQAELATSKHLNLYWSGATGPDAVDVGGMIEVRSVDERYKRLRLDDKDPDALPFVLVYSRPPVFELLGWIRGDLAKVEANWGSMRDKYRPAYWVDQSFLWPIEWLLRDLSKLKVYEVKPKSQTLGMIHARTPNRIASHEGLASPLPDADRIR